MILSVSVVLSVVPVSIPIPVVSVVSAPTVIHLFSSLSDPYLILQSLLLNLFVVSGGLSFPKCSLAAPKKMGICHFLPHFLFLLLRVTWTCVQSSASTFLLSQGAEVLLIRLLHLTGLQEPLPLVLVPLKLVHGRHLALLSLHA